MRAFRVYVNGKRLCVAGIGEHGVLTTTVTQAVGHGRDELFLNVGGLISPTGEFVDWVYQELKTGDEIRIKIVASKLADEPVRRRQDDPKANLKRQKKYVRDAAKKLGWKITTSR
jgi:hypothetical protein